MTTLKRLGATTVALALALGLSACSDDPSTPTPTGTAAKSTTTAPTSTATATGTATSTATGSATAAGQATPTVDPKTGLVDYCDPKKQGKPFTGAAAETFGAEQVMEAYCVMADFALNEGYSDLMEAKPGRKAVEFAHLRPYLTESAWKDFESKIPKALKGDLQSTADIQSLVGFNFESDQYQFVEGAPRAVHKKFGTAQTSVSTTSGSPRLVMTMTVSADMVYKRAKDGVTVAWPMTSHKKFWLTPSGNPERPWLIDGWTHTSEMAKEDQVKPLKQ